MQNFKSHITFGRPFQIFTALLISLFAVAAADAIIIGMVEVLTYWRYLPQKQASQLDTKELTPEELKAKRINDSRIEVIADGTIHLLYFSGRMSGSTIVPPFKYQIFDTNENLIWEGNEPNIPYQYLDWSEDVRPYLEYNTQDYQNHMSNFNINREFDAGNLRNSQSFVPDLSQTLEFRFETHQGGLEFWQYNPNKDFFTGYEAMGPKIGFLSASDFSDSKTDIKPFGKFGSVKNFTEINPFTPAILWQTDKRLYEINFADRKAQVLFESNQINIESFSTRRCLPAGFSSIAPYLKLYNENCRPFIDCVLQDKSHHLILSEPRSNLRIKLPKDWENWYQARVEITAIKDAIFLHRSWSKIKPPPPYPRNDINNKKVVKWRIEIYQKPFERIDEIYKVNEDGSLLLLNSFSRIRSPIKFQKKILTTTKSMRAILREFSSPLYTIINNKFEDKISDGVKSNNGFIAVSSAMISELHPDKITPNLILSAMFVLLALWHGWARRTSSVKLILWLVIVAAFNLAGLLAYLALNHTPVIKCQACGKKRGLETDNCPRCGAPLPIPQHKPTDLIMAN
jgi:hypothetical protein